MFQKRHANQGVHTLRRDVIYDTCANALAITDLIIRHRPGLSSCITRLGHQTQYASMLCLTMASAHNYHNLTTSLYTYILYVFRQVTSMLVDMATSTVQPSELWPTAKSRSIGAFWLAPPLLSIPNICALIYGIIILFLGMELYGTYIYSETPARSKSTGWWYIFLSGAGSKLRMSSRSCKEAGHIPYISWRSHSCRWSHLKSCWFQICSDRWWMLLGVLWFLYVPMVQGSNEFPDAILLVRWPAQEPVMLRRLGLPGDVIEFWWWFTKWFKQ